MEPFPKVSDARTPSGPNVLNGTADETQVTMFECSKVRASDTINSQEFTGHKGNIQAVKAKIKSLGSEMKVLTKRKDRTETDLNEHCTSRVDAKESTAKLREKEVAADAKEKADRDANAAIEARKGSSFTQTPAEKSLGNYVAEKADLPDMSQQELLAFLSGTQNKEFASAEIV